MRWAERVGGTRQFCRLLQVMDGVGEWCGRGRERGTTMFCKVFCRLDFLK
jgi:hypothetical protein